MLQREYLKCLCFSFFFFNHFSSSFSFSIKEFISPPPRGLLKKVISRSSPLWTLASSSSVFSILFSIFFPLFVYCDPEAWFVSDFVRENGRSFLSLRFFLFGNRTWLKFQQRGFNERYLYHEDSNEFAITLRKETKKNRERVWEEGRKVKKFRTPLVRALISLLCISSPRKIMSISLIPRLNYSWSLFSFFFFFRRVFSRLGPFSFVQKVQFERLARRYFFFFFFHKVQRATQRLPLVFVLQIVTLYFFFLHFFHFFFNYFLKEDCHRALVCFRGRRVRNIQRNVPKVTTGRNINASWRYVTRGYWITFTNCKAKVKNSSFFF